MDHSDEGTLLGFAPVVTWAIPSPEAQVLFLRNIQRILAEGLFVASYKFALIHALADLAVIHGDDTGAPLTLETHRIAGRFVELYWQQCRPFQIGSATDGVILRYGTGKRPEIVSKIVEAQDNLDTSLFRFQQSAGEWGNLVKSVRRVICGMPLWKLQTVGREQLCFLYDNQKPGTQAKSITLKPGITYCFRAFYELVRDLIEGAWIRFVQRLNVKTLGSITELGTFLFGQERASLDAYRPILMDVQKGKCLYCGKEMDEETQVDHFIPWSRYPVDLGHNFVLAHITCNNNKSDYLAAERHLQNWAERNRQSQQELQARFLEGSLPNDLSASIKIAQWIYHQTEAAHGQVWVEKGKLEHLGPGWVLCLSA